MKLHVSFLLLLAIQWQTFSQSDLTNGADRKGMSLGKIDYSVKEIKKPKILDFNNDNGFKTAGDALKKEQERQLKEEALKNRGILTRAKVAEERYLKSFKKINGLYNYPIVDQDLGSLRTHSKSVTIACRDFQYPDGDRVTIFVNDVPVIINLTLEQNYQSFYLPLNVGINTIKVVALNQGSSGPNTAAFKVYNDAGMILTSNEWNLATGAKATLIIAKDK